MLQIAFGGLCGAATGVLLSQPLTGLVAGATAGGAVALIPPTGERATPAGPAATLRANHVLASILTVRHLLAGALVCTGAAALTGASLIGWVVAATGFFGLGAFIGVERNWLRFRITQLALSTRAAGSMLPRRLVALLTEGTRPERNTIRVNGTAWQFRHANIQDHLSTAAHTNLLRRRADAGDGPAARQLAGLLREQGNLDEAIAVVRRRADAGDVSAAGQLAELLREQGNLDELRRRADAGDGPAAWQLAWLLREQGNLDELRRPLTSTNR
ncbi:hypothetical protein [Actinoplanes aureus]|uniref:hypothetical protein n=1 Tax=Actinoplanes aureus TaxID=2792083 RepID=UPI0018C2313C|nr:hypothetical protein [Actinoplanes aureus]